MQAIYSVKPTFHNNIWSVQYTRLIPSLLDVHFSLHFESYKETANLSKQNNVEEYRAYDSPHILQWTPASS